MQQIDVDPELSSSTKIKLKRIVELNEKLKAVKQLDNNRKTSTWTTARQYLSRQTHKPVKNELQRSVYYYLLWESQYQYSKNRSHSLKESICKT